VPFKEVGIESNVRMDMDADGVALAQLPLRTGIRDVFNISWALNDSLRIKKPCRQLEIMARCSHGDRDTPFRPIITLTGDQPDLQRLLNHEDVFTAFALLSTNLLYRETSRAGWLSPIQGHKTIPYYPLFSLLRIGKGMI